MSTPSRPGSSDGDDDDDAMIISAGVSQQISPRQPTHNFGAMFKAPHGYVENYDSIGSAKS